jgi:DNA polymerase-3 subunit gamma/tau
MMTPGAFNALLKTLEEPPSHVIFVLATTEAHKIIPTIISRCQRFDFGKVLQEDIHQRLETVLKQEKIVVDPLALKAIIDLADGGVRDALSLLDQVIAFTNGTVKETDVLQLFGLISQADKIRLFEAIGLKQGETIGNLIQSMQSQGADFKRLIIELLDMLKDVLVLLQTKQSSLLLKLSMADVERILESLGQEGVEALVPLLMSLLTDFKSVSQLPLLLEMSLLHYVTTRLNKSSMPTMTQVLEKSNQPAVQTLPSSLASQSLPLATEGEAIYIDDVNIIKIMVAGDKEKKQDVIEQWARLANLSYDARLGKVASLLKQGKPYVLSQHVLVLEFDQAQDAKQLNLVLNQEVCQVVYHHFMHEKIVLYGVNRQESIKLRKLFLDLSQLGQLPTKTTTPPTIKNWTLS